MSTGYQFPTFPSGPTRDIRLLSNVGQARLDNGTLRTVAGLLEPAAAVQADFMPRNGLLGESNTVEKDTNNITIRALNASDGTPLIDVGDLAFISAKEIGLGGKSLRIHTYELTSTANIRSPNGYVVRKQATGDTGGEPLTVMNIAAANYYLYKKQKEALDDAKVPHDGTLHLGKGLSVSEVVRLAAPEFVVTAQNELGRAPSSSLTRAPAGPGGPSATQRVKYVTASMANNYYVNRLWGKTFRGAKLGVALVYEFIPDDQAVTLFSHVPPSAQQLLNPPSQIRTLAATGRVFSNPAPTQTAVTQLAALDAATNYQFTQPDLHDQYTSTGTTDNAYTGRPSQYMSNSILDPKQPLVWDPIVGRLVPATQTTEAKQQAAIDAAKAGPAPTTPGIWVLQWVPCISHFNEPISSVRLIREIPVTTPSATPGGRPLIVKRPMLAGAYRHIGTVHTGTAGSDALNRFVPFRYDAVTETEMVNVELEFHHDASGGLLYFERDDMFHNGESYREWQESMWPGIYTNLVSAFSNLTKPYGGPSGVLKSSSSPAPAPSAAPSAPAPAASRLPASPSPSPSPPPPPASTSTAPVVTPAANASSGEADELIVPTQGRPQRNSNNSSKARGSATTAAPQEEDDENVIYLDPELAKRMNVVLSDDEGYADDDW
jgi:hypothetical protein